MIEIFWKIFSKFFYCLLPLLDGEGGKAEFKNVETLMVEGVKITTEESKFVRKIAERIFDDQKDMNRTSAI